MHLKTLVEERFEDYKYPSLYIGCVSCGGKCAIDGKFSVSKCINNVWKKSPDFFIDDNDIIQKYLRNPITSSIVFGLLEPMEQFQEIYEFVSRLRNDYGCYDDVVIYTGYTEGECESAGWVEKLYSLKNIVVKFGRYIPGHPSHYDETLGVDLASPNQYAVKLNPCND